MCLPVQFKMRTKKTGGPKKKAAEDRQRDRREQSTGSPKI